MGKDRGGVVTTRGDPAKKNNKPSPVRAPRAPTHNATSLCKRIKKERLNKVPGKLFQTTPTSPSPSPTSTEPRGCGETVPPQQPASPLTPVIKLESPAPPSQDPQSQSQTQTSAPPEVSELPKSDANTVHNNEDDSAELGADSVAADDISPTERLLNRIVFPCYLQLSNLRSIMHSVSNIRQLLTVEGIPPNPAVVIKPITDRFGMFQLKCQLTCPDRESLRHILLAIDTYNDSLEAHKGDSHSKPIKLRLGPRDPTKTPIERKKQVTPHIHEDPLLATSAWVDGGGGGKNSNNWNGEWTDAPEEQGTKVPRTSNETEATTRTATATKSQKQHKPRPIPTSNRARRSEARLMAFLKKVGDIP
ncbi:hypothetical protein Pelo_9847 [Pelomyxa schiedti]|nr:hypothetical protein Pelo_9847 [Pelomyxa schiedti]